MGIKPKKIPRVQTNTYTGKGKFVHTPPAPKQPKKEKDGRHHNPQ